MWMAIKQRILAFSLPSCHFENKLVYFVQEVALLLLWNLCYEQLEIPTPGIRNLWKHLPLPSQSTLRLLRPLLSCFSWPNGGGAAGDLTLSKWSRYFCPKKVVFWPRVINRFCMSTLLFVWRGGCWNHSNHALEIIEFIGGAYDVTHQNSTLTVGTFIKSASTYSKTV